MIVHAVAQLLGRAPGQRTVSASKGCKPVPSAQKLIMNNPEQYDKFVVPEGLKKCALSARVFLRSCRTAQIVSTADSALQWQCYADAIQSEPKL
jgi:hypothetical protein